MSTVAASEEENPPRRSDMTIRAFSYGGGVQSTAALVLAAQGLLEFSTFIFANVGANAENPDTLTYIEDYSKPFAKDAGIELIEVRKEWRDGRGHTLYDSIVDPKTRSIGIPIRMKGSGAPGNRACTETFKIAPIAKWMKQHGATRAQPGVIGLGISVDEWQRMRSESGVAWYTITYPLVDMRLNRSNCHSIIQSAGLPVPPKSSCYFCPYHSMRTWREMKKSHPDLFEKAADLEQTLIDRRLALGRDEVYLTDRLKPLRAAVGNQEQNSFWDESDACESGYCMV